MDLAAVVPLLEAAAVRLLAAAAVRLLADASGSIWEHLGLSIWTVGVGVVCYAAAASGDFVDDEPREARHSTSST